MKESRRDNRVQMPDSMLRLALCGGALAAERADVGMWLLAQSSCS